MLQLSRGEFFFCFSLTWQPLKTSVEHTPVSNVDYSAYEPPATRGDDMNAHAWATAHAGSHTYAPFVNSTSLRLPESTLAAGTAYHDGVAFPAAPNPYVWGPTLGHVGGYIGTDYQYPDPSLSLVNPSVAYTFGNGYQGPSSANNIAADAIGNDYQDTFAASSYAAGVNGNGFQGRRPEIDFTAGIDSNGDQGTFQGNGHAAYANGNGYQGLLPEHGFAAGVNGNGYQGPFFQNGFTAGINSNLYQGPFPADGFNTQGNTAVDIPAAIPTIDSGATTLVGTAQSPPPRHICAMCPSSFSRKTDLTRHANKHQAHSNVYRCQVAGCDYSSYRKDKVDEHYKRHQRRH